MQKIMFAPSLMCMDLLNVKGQITILDKLCDLFHVDVMDGNYVRNFGLSNGFVEAVKPHTTKPIDVHLMVEHPQDFIEVFAKAGADYISPHCDTIVRDAFRMMDTIRSFGCKTGVVLNPADPLEAILPYIGRLDKITVMGIDPGYTGQKFIPETIGKIEKLDALRKAEGLDFLIEVDGGGKREHFKELAASGADILIIGLSGLFSKHEDIGRAWDIMLNDFRESTELRATS